MKRQALDVEASVQVDQGDLARVTAATGAHVQTTVNNFDPSLLGSCTEFEEKQVIYLAKPISSQNSSQRLLPSL